MKQEEWVDVYNDVAIRKAGIIRPIMQSPRDSAVWSKTPNERRILQNVKFKSKNSHFGYVDQPFIKVWSKLIIQLKKNKVFPKTTYSVECWQSDIQNYLSKYKDKKSNNLVDKYYWNGKTYKYGDLPFWK